VAGGERLARRGAPSRPRAQPDVNPLAHRAAPARVAQLRSREGERAAPRGLVDELDRAAAVLAGAGDDLAVRARGETSCQRAFEHAQRAREAPARRLHVEEARVARAVV